MIVSVLGTFTEIENDRYEIYRYLQKTGYIEKCLGIGNVMALELREVILAYNNSDTFPTRIQILSAVVNCYSFFELNSFNKV